MAERSVRALLVVALVLITTAAAARDGVAVDGEPCAPGSDGVTVVVDLQELGDDTVLVRCAPDAPPDGFAALEQAGIAYRTTVAFPGFVCRIVDRPADDPCATTAPADAYWSYWLAPAGGAWCYSNKGAGNRTPPPGSVEGWSFSLDHATDDVPPPRHDPPGDPAGAAPLAADDCTAGAVPTTGADRAVGRGEAVDVAAPGDEGSGSPAGTILGVTVVAVVAAVAVLLTLARRRPPRAG